jgi:glycine/D-amino acid oxidase-like deaminating enzyme
VVPLWLDEEPEPLPRVRLAGAADVAVIGGGVTGCACALALAEGGLRVRLHEAREVASGASGRNGGFALRGGAMPYDVARTQLGAERAQAYWRLSEHGLDRLEALAGDAFRRVGSLRLAADDEELAGLEREYETLRDDGFDVEWHADALAGFRGAILHRPDGAIQPARWVRRLARLAAEAGVEIREWSRVPTLDEAGASKVVIATDGYTSGLLAELDRTVRPTRGQMLATERLPERRFDRPHSARRGYDYWQQTPDGRLVLGGRRDVALDAESTGEEAVTDEIQRALEGLLERLVGRMPRVTHRWAGIFGTVADRMPLAGPVPGREGAWVACGYSGHGNVLGLVCGELVAAAILGARPAELELFDPARILRRQVGDAV